MGDGSDLNDGNDFIDSERLFDNIGAMKAKAQWIGVNAVIRVTKVKPGWH